MIIGVLKRYGGILWLGSQNVLNLFMRIRLFGNVPHVTVGREKSLLLTIINVQCVEVK